MHIEHTLNSCDDGRDERSTEKKKHTERIREEQFFFFFL